MAKQWSEQLSSFSIVVVCIKPTIMSTSCISFPPVVVISYYSAALILVNLQSLPAGGTALHSPVSRDPLLQGPGTRSHAAPSSFLGCLRICDHHHLQMPYACAYAEGSYQQDWCHAPLRHMTFWQVPTKHEQKHTPQSCVYCNQLHCSTLDSQQ